jgi:hypothetical protein
VRVLGRRLIPRLSRARDIQGIAVVAVISACGIFPVQNPQVRSFARPALKPPARHDMGRPSQLAGQTLHRTKITVPLACH